MAFLRSYYRLITTLNRWFAQAMSVLVFVMVGSISYEVVSRYLFDAPTVWALELSSLLLGPYFILAGPYMLHIGAHVNVDILYNRFPPRVSALVDCGTFLIIVALCVIVINESWPVALDSFESGETSFSAWNPPVWPIKMIVPAAFVLLMLQALAEIIRAAERALACDGQAMLS